MQISEANRVGQLAAREALQMAGLDARHIWLVSEKSRLVYGAELTNGDRVAPRVLRIGGRNEPFLREQSIAYALRNTGAPIIRPLHEIPYETPHGLVGLWEWHEFDSQPVNMRAWGESVRCFHEAASELDSQHEHDVMHGFFTIENFADALSAEDHALRSSRDAVVRDFGDALADARRDVDAAVASMPKLFLHGDIHRSNCTGNPVVLYDLEYCGLGTLANEFSLLGLGVHRYGWPREYLDEFRRGYGDGTPTDEELEPFSPGRIGRNRLDASIRENGKPRATG